MQLQISNNALRLDTAFGTVLRCDESFPLLYVGRGEEHVDMYRGNFKIEDYVVERRPLRPVITKTEDGAVLEFENALTLRLTVDGDCAVLSFTQLDPAINRLWLRIPAKKDEYVWGCGEQMSYFNLRGRAVLHRQFSAPSAGKGRGGLRTPLRFVSGDGVLSGQPPFPRFPAAGLRPRRNLPRGDRVQILSDNKKLTSVDVSFFLFCSFTPAA
jgi:hypothetical protein